MEDMPTELRNNALMAAAGLGFLIVVAAKRDQWLNYIRRLRDPLRHRRIEVIQNTDDCQKIVNVLKRHCNSMKVLGFDCEWVTVSGIRRPIALLQLSSGEGLCALFRLCSMQQIPKSLRDLLEDDEVLKVGVDPNGDAKKLCYDYGVGVASTYDLRFLAAATGRKAEGLARMSKSVLNVTLDKNWCLVCSNWEAKELTEQQLHYAANDALVAVEIFKKLSGDLEPKSCWPFSRISFEDIRPRLEPFLELSYKESYYANVKISNNFKLESGRTPKEKKLLSVSSQKLQTKTLTTRSKALYDNCLLEAPDSELLCTIDRRKAQWYIDRNLGWEVSSEPFTVRLNFEPAGRAAGDVGKFYQTPKENQCVVCGHKEAFIRKNVVPKEYRKHFPFVMKTHSSHDVLLLCHPCHKMSNMSDLHIRHKLGKMCNAPFTFEEGALKFIEIHELKQVKSAARALLNHSDEISPERKTDLQNVLLNYYKGVTEVTDSLIHEAAAVETKKANDNYINHGERVVQAFQTKFGGLVELEKIWREHFLYTMEPRFLPLHWDVNHNANRLEIRASEGRVDPADLILAGLTSEQRVNQR